jgi:hypothetical protein
MTMTAELQAAERRLAQMISRRADSEEAEARDDAAAKRERVRADDLKCRDLAASYQPDFAAFGAEPPLIRGDEWASDYERRLLRGLQRRLSPKSDLADPQILADDCTPGVFREISRMVRAEAAREAASPSLENLPASVNDPRAKFERTDDMGQRVVEFRAKESFIRDLGLPGRRVLRIIDPRTRSVLMGPPAGAVAANGVSRKWPTRGVTPPTPRRSSLCPIRSRRAARSRRRTVSGPVRTSTPSASHGGQRRIRRAASARARP